MNPVNPKLSLIVPVRNEGVNLKIMLKVLSATVECSYEVVVIYDEDTDDSIPVLKELQRDFTTIRGIKNKYGAGVIHALRTGFEEARGKYILIFAADEVGPVIAIEDMLALMDQGCDLVSCTRYAHGGRRLGGSVFGGILSRFANRLFRLATPGALSDCTTGIKMFRRGIFESLDLSYGVRSWAVAFEMGIKAQFKGLQLGEVPIVSIDRLYGGKSTFKLRSSAKNYLYWFIWGIWRSLKGDLPKIPKILVRSSTYFNQKGKQDERDGQEAFNYRRDGVHRERLSS